MAAITYWVDPLNGNDANDGKSYANRIQTMTQLSTDLQAETDNNDFTVNCLNTADYTTDTTYSNVDVFGKNNSTFHFRGVSDSSATPGWVTVKPAGTGNNYFFYVRGHTSCLWEYFDFDGTADVGSASKFYCIGTGSYSNGLRVQYCQFRGGVASTESKSDVDVQAVRNVTGSTTGITDSFHIRYCYFENNGNTFLNSGTITNTTKVYDNVIIWNVTDTINYIAWNIIGGAAGWSFSFYDNTIYLRWNNTSTTLTGLIRCTEFSDNLNWDFYNNILFGETQYTSPSATAFVTGSGGSPTSSFTAITAIGYNLYLLSEDTDPGFVFTEGAYNGALPWDPDVTGPPDLYTGDIYNDSADGDAYFLDRASTYTWTPTDSSLDIDIAMDLRLIAETTSGLAGSTMGALPPAVTTYTVTCEVRKTYFKEGKPVSFDITVSNVGTEADDVVLTTSPMPADLNYISANAGQGVFTYNSVSKVGSWAVGTLAGGATATLTVGYIAPFGVEDDQVMTATWDSGSIGASDGSTLTATATAIPLSSTGGGGGGDGGDPGDNPATVPFIDTLPLQGDIHDMDINLRIATFRNREREQYVRSDVEGTRWAEARILRANIATNTATSINLGGIEQGHYLLVESDEPVMVSVNGTAVADYMPQAKAVVLIDTEIEELAVKNSSTTTAANVLIAVVD